MMNAKIKTFLYWLWAALPMIIALVWLPNVPDMVPLQYDFAGNITRHGHKAELLIVPALSLAIAALMYGFARAYSKKSDRGGQNARVILKTGWIVSFFFGVLTVAMLYYTSAETPNINNTIAYNIITFSVSMMFVLLGNLLPKCKRIGNAWWAVGFRTPWSMRDDTVWTKTNRFGAYGIVGIGLIGVVLSFFLPGYFSLMLVASLLVLVAVTGIIYSWHLYRKIHSED